ncbi:MAG: hypothetical protein HY927_03595 [Elusimicrobia bacterium]|nr:hypothetical protein [Elusimicrobiota bacterium]
MNLMREAVETELADGPLYEREAALFRAKVVEGHRIGKIFSRFAAEENAHREALKIILPSLDVSAGSPGKVPERDSLRDTLHDHAERELRAIRIYEAILKQPLSPMNALLIKGILVDEKEHLKTILHYLKALSWKE